MPIDMMNICAKFHSNPSTNYRDIVSHETGVNGQLTTDGQTNGQPENIMLSS